MVQYEWLKIGVEMNNYQDEYTRVHDKPTDGVRPSSNNGFIYSAYINIVDPSILDFEKLQECIKKCMVSGLQFKYNRHPQKYMTKKTPPNSRDEVMGILSLFKNTEYGKHLYKRLKENHWNFCNFEDYVKKPLTLNKIITAADLLYDIRNEHRNFVWQNNLEEAYCLAFRLPPSDVYYLKKLYGEKPTLLETAHFYAETFQQVYKEDKSGKMITWLKIKDMGLEGTFLGRKVIAKEADSFTNYFGENHILVKKLLDKSNTSK